MTCILTVHTECETSMPILTPWFGSFWEHFFPVQEFYVLPDPSTWIVETLVLVTYRNSTCCWTYHLHFCAQNKHLALHLRNICPLGPLYMAHKAVWVSEVQQFNPSRIFFKTLELMYFCEMQKIFILTGFSLGQLKQSVLFCSGVKLNLFYGLRWQGKHLVPITKP